LAVFCLATALGTTRAQSNYATVSGAVLDQHHRPVAGAHVHMTADDTGAHRDVDSNASGLYQIAGLQPGSYTLMVDNPGFTQATQAINLEVGQQAVIDMQLIVGGDAQTVTVQETGELLKTQDASIGEVVEKRSVDGLPLNGRMLIDLVLTVPGAHVSHGAATGDMSALYWRPGQRSAVSIGGSRPNANSVFGDTANAGTVVGENPIRANVTGQKVFGSGTRNSTTWFNPAAFTAPPAYTFGNSGRNTVYGPGTQTMDLGLVRSFSVAEKAKFEARAEFFNALNHTNLGTPNRFVNTSSFGSITEVSTPGREIQVSARVSF